MHLTKMISKDNKNEEEKRISAKDFEKASREEGAKLPDKVSEDKKTEAKKTEKAEKKAEAKKPETAEIKPADKKAEKTEKKPEDKKTEKSEKKSEDKKAEKTEGKPETGKTEKADKKPEEKKTESGSDNKKSDKTGENSEDKKSEEKKSEEKDPDKKSDTEKTESGTKKPDVIDFDHTEEKKRGIPLPVRILLIVLGVLIVIYLAVAFFFLSHFSFNIRVNGLDVSMMGLQEANRILCAQKGDAYELVITTSGNEVACLTNEDLNSKYDYTAELERLKASEMPFNWIPYLTYTRDYEIEPDLVFDEEKASEKILALDPVKHTPNEHKGSVNIKKSSQNGYILIYTDEMQPDQAKLTECIITAMHELAPTMELSETDYYVNIPYTELQQKAISLYDKIDAIQNTKIVFTDYGQEMQIDKDTLSGFLRTDSEGRFIVDREGFPTLDEEKIASYAEEVGEAFTTKDKNMWWKKYNGGTVSVNSGTYGKTVDTEAVAARIEQLVDNTEDYTGPPDYIVDPDADPNAPTEIGDTYIEVDMTRQKLYYIKDGRLFMTSDVVTGNSGRHHDTTQLMAYIYFMQRDRVLVGEDYRTPVKYWMAFHNHEGLHDASWRRSFGGDIYKYNGSHGCVNLPTAFAADLYDNVYVGLPVITYY